ncbi:GNAT family N-acetyltransferase [Pseudooceanicola nanhaiensis]|uniref:GNAT family N-acetyltransferase n=1 Tax=Pseudooceanicola nanhaiensis TaxID=375761 RepID=UPI001CD782FD|nr:GNAT family N-acetyltransferase [Pseudooceanicola nanhaiensis]MCA0919172.1 GNAT family N-acetyltransferase [Pseudooceanicola nanhaiensis]
MTLTLHEPYRLATAEDAAQLADLVFFAGEGLPLVVWQGLAGPGEDPWEVGRRRQAAKAMAGEIIVADHDGHAVAGLTGYVIGPDPEPIPDDMPALFRPLQELENLAPDSWYVNVLATYPGHRGRGLGSGLLGIAEELARNEGLALMSLIVADSNTGARRLYDRHGYGEVARRPCEKDGWESEVAEWILITKPLGTG